MIIQRTYKSYDTYVDRQGGKASNDSAFLLRHVEKKTGWFAREFKRAAWALKPGAMLCLGARTGAENLGAIRAGFPHSIGIDLHPVGDGVWEGDWHNLVDIQSQDFQNVFCNSLDHCYSLEKMCAEVKRVLTPGGRFYVMATNRQKTVDEWLRQKGMEALYWDTSDSLRDAIVEQGFTVTAEWRHKKWGHYIFAVTP